MPAASPILPRAACGLSATRAARIREDFLRSLRFFRFSARYGEGPLDAEGFRAAIQEREGLRRLSRERVRAELLKLLKAPRAGDVGGAMRARRACSDRSSRGAVYPDASPAAHRGGSCSRRGARSPAAARRAGIDRRRGRRAPARPPAPFKRRIRAAGRRGGRSRSAARNPHAPPSLGDLRALLFDRKRGAAQDALTLAHIDSGAAPDNPGFASAFAFLSDTPEPTLPFTGADIVARGIAQGRGVGAMLKTLQASWIRAGFPKEPEHLARLLEEALRKRRRE